MSTYRKPRKMAKANMLKFDCEGCGRIQHNRWAKSPNMTRDWFCSGRHFVKFWFYYLFRQPKWEKSA